MKTSALLLPILAGSVLVLVGCYERRVYVQGPPVVGYESGPAVVVGPPPPPQREVVVVAPGPAYVWCPGYWNWQGSWVWISGSWVARPHPGARWVPGYWAHRHHGYVYFRGYWR